MHARVLLLCLAGLAAAAPCNICFDSVTGTAKKPVSLTFKITATSALDNQQASGSAGAQPASLTLAAGDRVQVRLQQTRPINKIRK